MNEQVVIADVIDQAHPVAAEIIELTVEQMGEVGGGVAYVFL